MKEPEDAGQYWVNIDGTVQGQVIGDHNKVELHFHSPQDKAASSTQPERVWNVPYRRNPFFTGREDQLKQLREQLTTGKTTALTQPQAINGLGGIGKTQIALEYAYRYREAYHFIFWSSAATREALLSDFLTIANLLQLPQKDEQDEDQVIIALKKWFATHQQWLLILDNADDVAMVRDFVPIESPGHIVLTSRAQALGSLAQGIVIENMEMATGTLFLLRRTKLLAWNMSLDQASEEHLAGAEAIGIEMDFLPLALDQAGAYIEEVGCSLATYLGLYRTRRKELLRRRSQLPTDHPEPVATTWSLSFQKVERANPAAADLLRLCAFLEPDTIPEELVSEGSAHLGPVLQRIAADALKLNEAIEELRKFSLIQRHPDMKMLSVHRLVQVVLKDAMKRGSQYRWAERTVQATNDVFPQEIEVETWSRCRRYLPQAQSCATLIQDYALTFEEAAHLLSRTALYLNTHALYKQAELLCERALAIREKLLGPEHPDIATNLNNLAEVYREQGKYELAEPLYLRAFVICEQHLGPEHPLAATSLNNLALLYQAQGKYGQAEPLYEYALAICERLLGQEHPTTVNSLNNLATLYRAQGKYELAEPLYQRALAICERLLGQEHPTTASSLNGLAEFYRAQGKYELAEPLYQRALAIREKLLGQEHSDTATSLHNLATLYQLQGKYELAEPLYEYALAICEKLLGPEHPSTATSLNNLALLYREQGKYELAEPLLKHALAICEKLLGPEHPDIATSLNNLALLYQEQGKYELAEPLYEYALAICERLLGQEHPTTVNNLNNLATLYQAQGKYELAEPLLQRALAIREQHLGPEHSDSDRSKDGKRREARKGGKLRPVCGRAMRSR